MQVSGGNLRPEAPSEGKPYKLHCNLPQIPPSPPGCIAAAKCRSIIRSKNPVVCWTPVLKLEKGKSFFGKYYDGMERCFHVSECVIDWQTDTKGFLQPVFRFKITCEETGNQWQDYVTALK